MCSTPFGINGSCTTVRQRVQVAIDVLNAFRHQWKLHGYQALPLFRMLGCSTPFGINGSCTPGSARLPTAAIVLNAFRHQWKLHLVNLDDTPPIP